MSDYSGESISQIWAGEICNYVSKISMVDFKFCNIIYSYRLQNCGSFFVDGLILLLLRNSKFLLTWRNHSELDVFVEYIVI
jgi:hypothetical protein